MQPGIAGLGRPTDHHWRSLSPSSSERVRLLRRKSCFDEGGSDVAGYEKEGGPVRPDAGDFGIL